MDEITQKVVDGTAWRGVLRPAQGRRRGHPRRTGNPDDPLDRAEGYRMLTRLLRGALESKLEYGRADPARAHLHLPRDDQDRRREPRQPLPRRLARREVRLPDLGHARRGEVDQLQPLLRCRASAAGGRGPAPRCTRSRCTSSPTAAFEVIISQREHPGNWLRSEPDTRSLALRQTFLDKRNQEHAELHIERIDADDAPARAAHPRGALPVAAVRRPLREGRRRDRRPVGDPPVAVAQRVHRRGRARPRDRQVQGPADQVAPGVLRPGRGRGARRRGHAARVRVLDDRPPQPLDGDARLRPPPGHPELPLRRSSSPTAASGS